MEHENGIENKGTPGSRWPWHRGFSLLILFLTRSLSERELFSISEEGKCLAINIHSLNQDLFWSQEICPWTKLTRFLLSKSDIPVRETESQQTMKQEKYRRINVSRRVEPGLGGRARPRPRWPGWLQQVSAGAECSCLQPVHTSSCGRVILWPVA